MSALHSQQTDNHPPYNWTVADIAALNALSPTVEDVNKNALVENDGSVWRWDGSGFVEITWYNSLSDESDVVFNSLLLGGPTQPIRLWPLFAETSGTGSTTMKTSVGGDIPLLASRQTAAFEALIAYRENLATAFSGTFRVRGLIDMGDAAASCAMVGSADIYYTQQDGATTITATANTTVGGLDITVNGISGRNLIWRGLIQWIMVRADL